MNKIVLKFFFLFLKPTAKSSNQKIRSKNILRTCRLLLQIEDNYFRKETWLNLPPPLSVIAIRVGEKFCSTQKGVADSLFLEPKPKQVN